MFGKKQNTEITEKERCSLYEIGDLTEQPDFEGVLRLLPSFNIQHIPDDFMYKDSLVLKEKVEKDEDGVIHRTDYVITPKKGIKKLNNGRIAIDSKLSRRFDDLIGILGGKNFFDDYRKYFFNNSDIRRYLSEDGAEVYTYNGIEMLEVKADICKECKDCNETAPLLWGLKNNDQEIEYNQNHNRIVRDIREYKINPPFLGLFFGTGVHISRLTHPCQWRTLHEILNPDYEVADPPEIKIVFPKQK